MKHQNADSITPNAGGKHVCLYHILLLRIHTNFLCDIIKIRIDALQQTKRAFHCCCVEVNDVQRYILDIHIHMNACRPWDMNTHAQACAHRHMYSHIHAITHKQCIQISSSSNQALSALPIRRIGRYFATHTERLSARSVPLEGIAHAYQTTSPKSFSNAICC